MRPTYAFATSTTRLRIPALGRLARYLACSATCAFVGFHGLGTLRAAASPSWRMLEAPRFSVVSQMPDAQTRTWATQFGQFLDALNQLMPQDEKARPSLTVVLFADENGFEDYKPSGSDGKHAPGVSGTFASRNSWGVVGMASQPNDRESRDVLFHEGVHWHMSGDHRAQPVWFEEGLAEVFSTFRIERGRAHWGEMPAAHVAFLKEAKLFPLRKILGATREDPLFGEHMSAAVFYAQSWALVHTLLFGERADGRESLAVYLKLTRAGASIEEACRRAFGRTCDELQEEVAEHLSGDHQRLIEQPMMAGGALDGAIKSAPPLVVEAALAHLALGSGHVELAQQHCQRAVSLAPNQPAGYELYVDLAGECGDGDAVETAARRAIELGTKDSGVYVALGQEEIRRAGDSGEMSAAQARRVADLFVDALDLNPHVQLAYENFSRALCSADAATPRDLELLARGRKLFPADGEIILGQAILAANRGARAEAVNLLREALQPEIDLSEEGRNAAREMAAAFDSEKSLQPQENVARDRIPGASATAG